MNGFDCVTADVLAAGFGGVRLGDAGVDGRECFEVGLEGGREGRVDSGTRDEADSAELEEDRMGQFGE